MKKIRKIRDDLQKWREYEPVPSAESISIEQKMRIESIDKLDAGENMYGPSPLVTKRLSEFRGYQFYPDPGYRLLREKLGLYAKVDPSTIFVSNGADEIIDLILRVVLENGDEVIDCPPTFSSYSLSTLLNRGVVKNVQRTNDFSLDMKRIIKSITNKAKIIFICNPNNPTGNVTPIDEIKEILETGIFVCIDEAYIEFGGKSAVSLLDKYENLIIIRSFSKWAGIAGLRLGYGIMSENLIKQIMKVKSPYNVNISAVIAGIASLEDTQYKESVIKAIKSERTRMEAEIEGMKSFKLFVSGGNFAFLQATKVQLKKVRQECKKQRVAFRYYDSKITGQAIRITVGKPKQNTKVISILKESI